MQVWQKRVRQLKLRSLKAVVEEKRLLYKQPKVKWSKEQAKIACEKAIGL